MNNKDFKGKEDKLDFWISMIANLITIGTPITTYFIANDVFLYVTVVFLLITIIRNILKGYKLSQCKVKLYKADKKNKELNNNIEIINNKNQELKSKIDYLNNENRGYNIRLNRIRDDLISGKVSSDILINYFIDEVDNQFVKYFKMNIDAQVVYKENEKQYDVKYIWRVDGQNPSNEKELSELSFVISGDSIVKKNEELGMRAEIKKANGEWKEVNTYINGADKIKYLHINLKEHPILPSQLFSIRFSYVWPKSYFAEGKDVFAFGNNTFSSTDPYDLYITVHGNNKCFTTATQQIRAMINNNDVQQQFSELVIIERGEENYVTTSLPKSENNRAIYISLIQ